MTTRERGTSPIQGLAAIVGFLVAVEVASGVLQGFYTPIYPQIAEHLDITEGDINWFEAAQLIVSALAIPLLARLGDLVGHKRVLLIATAVTALGSWITVVAPTFTTFLIGWALQAASIIWLPLEIAIIHRRTRESGRQSLLTRRGAAVLVGALELAVIVGALTSGAIVDGLDMTVVLAIPAVVVTVVLVLVWFGIEDVPGESSGGIDWTGLGLITLALGLVMAGLVLVRLDGADSVRAWLVMLLGALVLVPFVRHERGVTDPIVDVDLLASPAQWPIQLTAFLFGIPVLGGQIPLSTFAQADPDVRGYGLGADSGFVSTLIGVYVITLAIGAFTLPVTTRLLGVRRTLIVACLLVAGGYALWLPFHDTTLQAIVNISIAGLGSGALVASLPAAAAAAAPAERTGIATGMTNGTKVIGGAIASSIFAIALASTGSMDKLGEESAAPLSGYLVVWGVCSGAALLAAIALMTAPKVAFTEA
jgi:MFS family permease